MKNKFIKFVISVLYDDHGISESSYNLLLDMACSKGVLPDLRENVLQYVNATDGRFYLPEGWTDRQYVRKHSDNDMDLLLDLPTAERYIEKHARIIKLPSGNWRVWLCGKRWYGSKRSDAIRTAAQVVFSLKSTLSNHAS